MSQRSLVKQRAALSRIVQVNQCFLDRSDSEPDALDLHDINKFWELE